MGGSLCTVPSEAVSLSQGDASTGFRSNLERVLWVCAVRVCVWGGGGAPFPFGDHELLEPLQIRPVVTLPCVCVCVCVSVVEGAIYPASRAPVLVGGIVGMRKQNHTPSNFTHTQTHVVPLVGGINGVLGNWQLRRVARGCVCVLL